MWFPGKPNDGAAYGVAFKGGGSSPSGSTTTTTNTAPWTGQQPYLQNVFTQAQNLYDKGTPAYFPGSTYDPLNPQQTSAIDAQFQRGMTGSPLVSGAQSQIGSTINGDYLNPASNPYLQATYDAAAGNVTRGVRQEFSGDDASFGAPAHQAALGNALGNLATSIYGQNYHDERQRQVEATQLAPALANQDFTDLAQAQAAGGALQQNAQNQTNADIQRYNYEQQAPWNNLANFAGFVNGNYGGSSTQTQPYFGGGGKGAGIGGLLGAGAGLALAPATGGTSLLLAGGLGAGLGSTAGNLFSGGR